MAVTTTYHMIGRFNWVLSVSPSSLFTAVFASQLNATRRRTRSSVLITTRRPSASPLGPMAISGDNNIEKITRKSPSSVLTKTTRKTVKAISRMSAKSIVKPRLRGSLLHPDYLTGQAEAPELLALCLGLFGGREVTVTDHERDGLARLGRHPHLLTGGAEPLGYLHRPPERQRRADSDRQRLVLVEHRHVVEPLVAQARNERLRLARRRDLLDEDRVDRGIGLLAEARGLVAGLIQLALDPLGLRRHDEGTHLDGKARPVGGGGPRGTRAAQPTPPARGAPGRIAIGAMRSPRRLLVAWRVGPGWVAADGAPTDPPIPAAAPVPEAGPPRVSRPPSRPRSRRQNTPARLNPPLWGLQTGSSP